MSTITVGVIGLGRIGRIHTDNLLKLPKVRVKSAAVNRLETVQEWADERGISLTLNHEDLFKDPEIDAVIICSPTNTHATYIKEAAQAGKHIFCEKPISFSPSETAEALRVVKEAGVKLQVGFNRRFDPNFKRIRELVEQGNIGDVHILKITSRDPEPPGESYIATSGGMFMDMTIHDFDMARYIMNSDVVEVYVQGAVLVDPVFAKYDDVDTAIITLKFANGAIGVIDNSRKAVYGYDQRLEVFGSKGAAHADHNRETTVELLSEENVTRDKPLYFFLERYKDAFQIEMSEFIRAIQQDTPVVCTGEDALKAEKIAQAAFESLKKQAPVKL